MRLPESVDLPLGVQIEKIEVGRILLGKSNNPVVESGAVSYQFDHQNHKLNIVSLRLPWHNFSGNATLNTAPPSSSMAKSWAAANWTANRPTAPSP